MKRVLRSQDGANAVEFALVLPILVILLFGIFTLGLAYNVKLVANHASRDAARFGATLPYMDSDGDNEMDLDWYEDVRDRAVDAGEGQFGSTSGGSFTGFDGAVICVSYNDGSDWRTFEWVGTSAVSGPTTTPCFPDTLSGERVQVRLQRDTSFNIVFLPSKTLTLTSDAVARFEDRPVPAMTPSPSPSP